jgi:hypothetical protein
VQQVVQHLQQAACLPQHSHNEEHAYAAVACELNFELFCTSKRASIHYMIHISRLLRTCPAATMHVLKPKPMKAPARKPSTASFSSEFLGLASPVGQHCQAAAATTAAAA